VCFFADKQVVLRIKGDAKRLHYLALSHGRVFDEQTTTCGEFDL
jgi:hypothetical protein